MTRQRRAKVISVVGARPQFVKLAALALSLERLATHRIVHTGQHFARSMSAVFFRELQIPRVYKNLRIHGGSHGQMTARMIQALERTFLIGKPDLVLVYGDTNTTLAGALAAAKLGIPVGHIEAGLRSGVNEMPEEINRKLTDHLATLLFCPTRHSVGNLRKEGIRRGVVHSGDLMYELIDGVSRSIQSNISFLKRNQLTPGEYVYLTAHRQATVDNDANLRRLLLVIAGIGATVLFPVHPRASKRLKQLRLYGRLSGLRHVRIAEPLPYLDSLTAARFASHVLTDSGGLQKEALFLGTPVLTLREETEWVETLARGNRLVGLDPKRVTNGLKSRHKTRPTQWRIGSRKPSRIIAEQVGRFLKSCR